SRSAHASEPSETPKSTRKTMYFVDHSRSCTPQGTFSWGTFKARAARFVSSCNAPNGHSQPQNGPRPQNSNAAATEHQRMKISGSTRNDSQRKPVRSESTKVSTLTTESCACAIQPSQNSVAARK